MSFILGVVGCLRAADEYDKYTSDKSIDCHIRRLQFGSVFWRVDSAGTDTYSILPTITGLTVSFTSPRIHPRMTERAYHR